MKIDCICQSAAGFQQLSVTTRQIDMPLNICTPVTAVEVVTII